DQPTLTVFRKRWRRVVQRGRMKPIAVTQIQCAELGLAKARRVRQHGIKDRLQFSGRTTDDTQHLGRRRLLLKRFAQLVEQPRVLDRDHRLVGEGLEKSDLLIGERINFGTSKLNCSDRYPLAEQWNTGRRPVPKPFRERASFGIFLRLSLEVDYVDRPTLENRPA